MMCAVCWNPARVVLRGSAAAQALCVPCAVHHLRQGLRPPNEPGHLVWAGPADDRIRLHTEAAVCHCHGMPHPKCPTAQRCIGGCGRLTTASESTCPGYCARCSAGNRRARLDYEAGGRIPSAAPIPASEAESASGVHLCRPDGGTRCGLPAGLPVDVGTREEATCRACLEAPDIAPLGAAPVGDAPGYKICCISLYLEDIDRLSRLVRMLRQGKKTMANRSSVIRDALRLLEAQQTGGGAR